MASLSNTEVDIINGLDVHLVISTLNVVENGVCDRRERENLRLYYKL